MPGERRLRSAESSRSFSAGPCPAISKNEGCKEPRKARRDAPTSGLRRQGRAERRTRRSRIAAGSSATAGRSPLKTTRSRIVRNSPFKLSEKPRGSLISPEFKMSVNCRGFAATMFLALAASPLEAHPKSNEIPPADTGTSYAPCDAPKTSSRGIEVRRSAGVLHRNRA